MALIVVAVLASGCGDDDGGGRGGAGSAAGSGGANNGGSAMGAAASGGGGGDVVLGCEDCRAPLLEGDGPCVEFLGACELDATCADWHACMGNCVVTDDQMSCFESCEAAHPGEADLRDPLLSCQCDACADSCLGLCGS